MTCRIFFVVVIALLSSCSVLQPNEQGFYALGIENGKEKYRMMGGYYGLAGDTYEAKYAELDNLLERELEARGRCPHGYKVTSHTVSQGGGYLIADAYCL